jgi:hypothetical protein
MPFLGKPTSKVRSDAPSLLACLSSGLLALVLMGCPVPLCGQSRATIQVSAQVLVVQPSAEGLQAAQAMARSGDPAPVRTGGRVPLATVRRAVQRANRMLPAPVLRLTAASGAVKPTSMIEIQFLRN